MKHEWPESALEDVAKVVNGGTPKTKVSEYWGGPHLWITPAEMGGLPEPYLRESRRTLTDEGLAHSSASLLPSKSVILSTRAPIGYLVINEKPMAFNQGCRGIVPGEGLHHKFLYYWLLSNVKRLDDLGSGTTFKELAAGKLKKFPVPTPPLSQQKRIVAILDEAFAGIEMAIANTEKNLINARELFNSYLDQSANPREAEAIHVGDHFETVTGNTPPKKDPENWGSFMPLVKPPELRYGRILDAADSLSKKGAAKARVAPKDAVLVSCIGNLGKVGLAEVSLAFNQQINAIFPRADIMLPEFLFLPLLKFEWVSSPRNPVWSRSDERPDFRSRPWPDAAVVHC